MGQTGPVGVCDGIRILAARGFGDASPCAQTQMVRDRFVSGHRDCALRRHLDSVPPDTPIRDIVDWCRVWESHLDTHVGYQRLPTVTDNNRESSTISGGFLKVAEEVGKTTTDSGLPDQ